MKEKIFFGLFILLVVFAGVLYFLPSKNVPPSPPPPPVAPPTPSPVVVPPPSPASLEINITTPQPNDIIMNPVKIAGEARGNWYFEASFPVTIMDANKKILAKVPMQAKGNWMTTEFVPFEGSISFTSPTTTTGFIVLENDNPSGDPARSKQVEIPVRFK